MLVTVLLSFVSGFIGSMLSFVIWVHFDFEGFLEQKKHERIVRKQRKNDPGAHQPPDPIPGVGDVGARPPQIYRLHLDKPEETR